MKTHRLRRALALLTLCTILISGLTVSASAAGFADVPANHWAAGEISRCVEHGFFQGQAPGHFGLGESMTRSAFTVVMGRFFGWETPKPAAPTYPDIPADAWYSGAVQAAFDHGALTRQSSTFRPTESITREEMTVMLLRAMGYSDLAGLTAETDCPFEDVTKNAGYITLANHLGLMNGTSATTFAPDRPATREQVAVIFMRLYDKLHAPAAKTVAILSPAEPLPDLTGFSAAAVSGGNLTLLGSTPSLREAMSAEDAALLRTAAQDAGAKVLLQISASPMLLQDKNTIENCAAKLAQLVTEGSYDGLLLDIPKLRHAYAARLTQLAAAADAALEGKLFYMMAEAPLRNTDSSMRYDGYDFPALAEFADTLVLRFHIAGTRKGNLTMAPPQPPEEIYDALRTLKAQGVSGEKTALLLTSTATLWKGANLPSQTLTAEEFRLLQEDETMRGYYSERYASAYLTGGTQTVWYLDGRSAAERVRLLRFFGVGQILLTDAGCAAPDFLSSWN